MRVHINIHTHIYVCMYVYIYIYTLNHIKWSTIKYQLFPWFNHFIFRFEIMLSTLQLPFFDEDYIVTPFCISSCISVSLFAMTSWSSIIQM